MEQVDSHFLVCDAANCYRRVAKICWHNITQEVASLSPELEGREMLRVLMTMRWDKFASQLAAPSWPTDLIVAVDG